MFERWTKPKLDDPDAQVRIEALSQLEPDDARLAKLAREDVEIEVRHAALHRSTDPEAIEACLQDGSEALRLAAGARLIELLAQVDTAEGDSKWPEIVGRSASLSAHVLAQIACSAAAPANRHAAFEALSLRTADAGTEAAWLAITHGAMEPDLRLDAARRLHSDEALQEALHASRGHDKRVLRLVQDELAAREEARRVATEKALLEQQLGEFETEVGAREEPLAAVQIARYRDLQALWAPLAPKLGDAGAELASRLSALADRVAEEQTQHKRREALLRDLASCAERLAGDEELEAPHAAQVAALDEIAAQWADVEAGAATDQARFEAVMRAARRALELRVRDAQLVQELDALVEAAAASAARPDFSAAARAEWQRKLDAHGLPKSARLLATCKLRLNQSESTLDAALQARNAERTARQKELTEQVDQIAKKLEAGELEAATTGFAALGNALTASVITPQAKRRLQQRLDKLRPRAQELRAWQRFGQDQVRTELCERAESFVGAEKSPPKLATAIRELRERWKALDHQGGRPNRKLWLRFDEACTKAYEPCAEFFAAQSAQRDSNLQARATVCERLESFVSAQDWDQPDWRAASDCLNQARAAWRKCGPIDRKQQRKVSKRFARATAALEEKLEPQRDLELRRRKFLLKQLAATIEREPLPKAIQAAKDAQRAWRPNVQAGRREERELWNELRALCDGVFGQQDESRASAREAARLRDSAREEICSTIDGLLAPQDTAAAAKTDLEQTLNLARGRFQQARQAWDELEQEARDAAQEGRPPNRERARGRDSYDRQRDRRPQRARRPHDPVPPALRKRYAKACKDFAGRVRSVEGQAAESRHRRVLDLATLAWEVERLVLDGAQTDGEAAASYRERWSAGPALKGALGKALDARFDAAIAALTDAGARAALCASVDENLGLRERLCLELEVLADVPSPASFQRQRMEYQVARLGAALAGGGGATSAEEQARDAETLFVKWCACGPVPPSRYDDVQSRFDAAFKASRG